MVQYTITNTNLHIVDSYKLSKKEFRPTLDGIESQKPEYDVWKRSKCGMCLEWAVHNALYGLGIARERTKDCDLDTGQPFWLRAAYAVCGIIVWPFIR